MTLDFMFFFTGISIGLGLAADAFSVSLTNGLNEPHMKIRKVLGIAGVFAGFQALMPLIGWICVHTMVRYFEAIQPAIPWIALILLAFIGGKMLMEGICAKDETAEATKLGIVALMVQGIATSIDALSVGFAIDSYNLPEALLTALLIAAVTMSTCTVGVLIGKTFGTKLSNKAQILGGAILIAIGLEIFITRII